MIFEIVLAFNEIRNAVGTVWRASSPVSVPPAARVLSGSDTLRKGGGVLIAKTFMSLFVVYSLRERERKPETERESERGHLSSPPIWVGGLWERGHCVVWLVLYFLISCFYSTFTGYRCPQALRHSLVIGAPSSSDGTFSKLGLFTCNCAAAQNGELIMLFIYSV